ncbi:MAG: phosphopantetheine-binding protein, partial [Actinobacteria bacterium]|nr:phosphopantetheine-binding protein [Actinomycetota bacterium]
DTRIYKTGDLVRWLPNGDIEYIGRNDFQVKIRGFRIEIGEIESSLSKCPGIGQCIVRASDGCAQKELVAYYVINATKKNTEITIDEVKAYLRQRLPEYMIPSYFFPLEKLPLTVNGKIDTKSLPQPDNKALNLGGDNIIANTDEEKALVAIWRDLLKLDRVGIQDNFFSIGGNSLMAIKLINQIRNFFHVDIELRHFFESRNIANTAKLIVEARNNHQSKYFPEIKRRKHNA